MTPKGLANLEQLISAKAGMVVQGCSVCGSMDEIR
jgi:hypothetical protein